MSILNRKGELVTADSPANTLFLDVDAIDHLGQLQTKGLSRIDLPFAKFTDGRAYSMARELRERYGFKGELRAVGDVLIDQLGLMLRVGFDSFALRADQSVEEAQRLLKLAGAPGRRFYQADFGKSVGASSIPEQRHASQ